jgi:hypothetical protein
MPRFIDKHHVMVQEDTPFIASFVKGLGQYHTTTPNTHHVHVGIRSGLYSYSMCDRRQSPFQLVHGNKIGSSG